MFEEEVGYSPSLGGKEYYSRRVKSLIRQGHSLVHVNAAGEVVFKAELDAVTPEVTQVQGVWMNLNSGTRPERGLYGRRGGNGADSGAGDQPVR